MEYSIVFSEPEELSSGGDLNFFIACVAHLKRSMASLCSLCALRVMCDREGKNFVPGYFGVPSDLSVDGPAYDYLLACNRTKLVRDFEEVRDDWIEADDVDNGVYTECLD